MNTFNISKINSEVRGGKSPRIKRLSEYIGESYFDYPAGMSAEEIERLKLEDGVRLHESVKVELETYARESDGPIVKSFLLVIAHDTTHAGQLMTMIQSDGFFEGRYKDKTIQVDSSRTGAEEEEIITRLLKVEHTEEPTEIVIHVNLLKEGWDFTNLYTIVPLRAANARILIEQSIGRGLRLPYGKRTGVTQVAQIAYEVIRRLENQLQTLPTIEHLKKSEIQAAIVKAVEEQRAPAQMELEGVIKKPDIASVVAKTVELIMQQTIDIPRILVVPRGEVKSGFKPFALKLDTLKYPAVSDELWIQHLRTNQLEVVDLGRGGIEEARLEDYVVSGLVDSDDISCDDHADLLYDLAAQAVSRFRSYLFADDTRKVLRCYQRNIARFIHVQMQDHYWEDAAGYEVRISKGFTELKPSAYTHAAQKAPADYRVSPADKSNMSKYLCGSFKRCLYPLQKCDSDAGRKLAAVLECDAIKCQPSFRTRQ